MNHSIINQEKIEKHSIDLFLAIGKILDKNSHSADALNPILMVLSDYFHLEDAAITIFDRKSKEIYVDASYGLSLNQQSKGRYQLGEGIIGEVVQTEKKIVVPRIKQEPKFLSKTKQRDSMSDYSFICVPIKDQGSVTGTLSITITYTEGNDLNSLSDFMEAIAMLLIYPIILKQRLSIAQKTIEEQNYSLAHQNLQPNIFIGNSRNSKPLKHLIYKVSKEQTSVFISGDHGTGKTYIANIIHNNSVKKDFPLVQCNCASISSDDIMYVLFGKILQNFGIEPQTHKYEGTPFILQAQNSTLLIEDIDLLSEQVQKILLQIIQSEEVLLDNQILKLSIRYIFTSEYPLSTLYQTGKIIQPLYEILEQNVINIPPLKERRDDIILIADKMLQEIVQNMHPQKDIVPKRLSTPAIDLLSRYHWPGNLNELYKVIESSIYKCDGGVIHAYMLPPSLQSAESTNTQNTQGLIQAVERFEKDLIIDALKSTNGHLSQTAHLLQISDRILGLRIKKYGINPKQFR